VEQIVGRGQQAAPEHIPFTPRAKKVLGLARREALQLGHHYIGTEHILLGLIREGDGVAAHALAALGAELNPVRQQVIRLLHGTQGTDELAGGRGGGSARRAGGSAGCCRRSRTGSSRSRNSCPASGSAWVPGRKRATSTSRSRWPAAARKPPPARRTTKTRRRLRDRQRQLLAGKTARQQEWAAAHPDLASLAGQLHRLGEEVGQLRDLLRQQDGGPHHGAA
jgi:hypothetical protein